MYTIYCIEDCNSLKYVGSTKHTINIRLSQHKCAKNKKLLCCSSIKLNLDNCKIYSLETDVSKSQKKERERYWINKIDCVNEKKLNGIDMDKYKKRIVEYNKDYDLFRSKKVVNGCYEFIKMLEEY